MTYPEIDTEDSFTKRERCYVKKQKEELRNKKKSLKNKEYQKLRVMVPSIASKPNVSKVTVIEEAVRYIDQLHLALLTKLEEQDASKYSDSIRKNNGNELGLLRSGSTALELVKNVDCSLYTKICDQMQAFAGDKFPLSKNLLCEDEFDFEYMVNETKDRIID